MCVCVCIHFSLCTQKQSRELFAALVNNRSDDNANEAAHCENEDVLQSTAPLRFRELYNSSAKFQSHGVSFSHSRELLSDENIKNSSLVAQY